MVTGKKAMGVNPLDNNALFSSAKAKPETKEDSEFTTKDIENIRASQVTDDGFTSMTFKIRKSYLKTIRDYAYTNRLEIKETLDEALKQFIDGIDTSKLLEYKEKPKKTRKRGK